jgi:hypothetical protein
MSASFGQQTVLPPSSMSVRGKTRYLATARRPPPKLQQIRQIHIGSEAVGEAQMHSVAIERLSFNQCWR